MSKNNFVDNDEVRAQKYSEKYFREKLPSLFWARFFNMPMPGSKGFKATQFIFSEKGNKIGFKSQDNSVIKVIRDLTKGLGDKVTFSHIKALVGDPVLGTSGDTLEGQEMDMDTSTYSVELEEYSGAVKDKSPLGRKRTMFDILKAQGEQITSWGTDVIERNIWNALYAGTPTTILYPGDVTSTAGIEDTTDHRVTMALLRQARAIAKTRDNGARYIIEPLFAFGKNWFIVVMSEDALLDLKEDSEFKQSMQNALQRSTFEKHPIFAAADYVTTDGMIIFGHERACQVTNWGATSDIPGARIKLMGLSAICLALGMGPILVGDVSDYGRAKGLSYQIMMKASRPTFDSIDFGSLEIRVNRQQTTDA